MENTIILAEEPFFGFQGEGNTQGKHSLFIRFPGCNLRCSYCDSKFSWNIKNGYKIEMSKLNEMLEAAYNVVITGGEPLLSGNMDIVLNWVRTYSASFEIETNGTITLTSDQLQTFNNHKVQFNISPKGNFEQETDVNTTPYIFQSLPKYWIVKFLLGKTIDLLYIKRMQEQFNIPSNKIYIQPIGVDSNTIVLTLRKYYSTILTHGWNISLRTHVILFENKQGV